MLLLTSNIRVLLWGHEYPCFGLLVMSPLSFKARVSSLIRILQRHMWSVFPEMTPLGWHLLIYMAAWQPVTVPHMCVSTAFVVSRKVMFSVVSVCQSIIHDAIGQIGTLHHMDQFKLVHMWPPILHPPSTYLLKLSCCVWYFTDNCMHNMSLSCTLLTVGDLFCNKYEIYSFEMAAVCLVNDSLAYLSYLK